MARKKRVSLPENKAEIPLYNSTLVEVIKAHDGLEVGRRFHSNERTIQKMISKGYWKRCV